MERMYGGSDKQKVEGLLECMKELTLACSEICDRLEKLEKKANENSTSSPKKRRIAKESDQNSAAVGK
jgi:hypothetical protein